MHLLTNRFHYAMRHSCMHNMQISQCHLVTLAGAGNLKELQNAPFRLFDPFELSKTYSNHIFELLAPYFPLRIAPNVKNVNNKHAIV